jgi:hypothetical protein
LPTRKISILLNPIFCQKGKLFSDIVVETVGAPNEEKFIHTVWKHQEPITGVFYTNYYPDGSPIKDASTELTTAIILSGIPETISSTEQWYENPKTLVIVICVITFIVILGKWLL